jgi:uncharacterized cupredoxin-like copper-binding protein
MVASTLHVVRHHSPGDSVPATRPLLTFVALLLLGAAFTSPSRDSARSRQPVADSLAAAPRSAQGTSSTARTVLVTAHDYAFTGVPARIHAGWITLRLVNAGTEVHMMGIERIPFGHSAHAVLEAIANDRPAPETSSWGGPNAVSPGDTATVTMFFSAGEYVISCAVESADGKMHLRHGMMTTMIVTGTSESPSAPLHEDADVTLTDYRVSVRGTLTAGDRGVLVRNDASQGHDLEILELIPGHSKADALHWFEHPGNEPPTARAIGGVVAIHPGQRALVSATFRPGRYLFLCWVPDGEGRPHFLRGMQQLVVVAASRGKQPQSSARQKHLASRRVRR